MPRIYSIFDIEKKKKTKREVDLEVDLRNVNKTY